MNTARMRLQRRRQGRRIHATILLVGIIFFTGFAIASRGGKQARPFDGPLGLQVSVEPGLAAMDGTGGPSDAWGWALVGREGQEAPGPDGALAAEPVLDGPDGGPFAAPAAGTESAGTAQGGQGDGQDGRGEGAEDRRGGAGGQPPAKPVVFIHEVRPGETLTHIAAAYGVDVETIAAANDLVQLDRIMPGDQLKIPSVKGALHVVRRGESLWDIARAYQVPMEDIIEANQLVRPERLHVGEQLVIPGAQALALAQRREAVVGRDGSLLRNFDWPVRGRISSRYGPRWGRMHNGLDIAVPTGTPVRAAAAGVVRFSGWNGGYGYLVTVDHGNGVETRYAHNSRLVVRVGQRVSRGQVLAYSGNTGNSTGPHVHFEIRHRGRPLNPERYLKR